MNFCPTPTPRQTAQGTLVADAVIKQITNKQQIKLRASVRINFVRGARRDMIACFNMKRPTNDGQDRWLA
jgi:hypothetical protein